MNDIDQLRDRLADLCGWTATTKFGPTVWRHPEHLSLCESEGEHPLPPGDLNALAAAWPEGWGIESRYSRKLKKWRVVVWDSDQSHDSGWADTEYEARLRLTVAVLEAKGATP